MRVAFLTMFNQITGLFALLLIGYYMNWSKILPKQTEQVLSKLATRLLLPALMLHTFMEECSLENLRTYGIWIVYGTIFGGLSVFLAILLARLLVRKDSYLQGVYRYALAFPNTGGVGTPVVLALFGTLGLFQYQLYQLFSVLGTYGWGVNQMIPNPPAKKLTDHLRNIFNPAFTATLIGAALGVTGISAHLPSVIPDTLERIGGAYAVISMLLVGFVLGDYQIKDMIRWKSAYMISVLRLLVLPCVFLVLLYLFHAPQTLCVLTCLTFACPCGMNTVVFPAAYGEDTKPGASMILVSSALSVLTIPCIYMLL